MLHDTPPDDDTPTGDDGGDAGDGGTDDGGDGSGDEPAPVSHDLTLRPDDDPTDDQPVFGGSSAMRIRHPDGGVLTLHWNGVIKKVA